MSSRAISALALPSALRRFFAWPRGPVKPGDFASLIGGVAVCVGDYVSRICSKSLGPRRSSIVFDGSTERRPTEPPSTTGYRVTRAANPRGTLSHEAYLAACRVAREPGWALTVEGEEDMLTLAVMNCARPGYTVVYGLPGRGAVLVRVDGYVRAEAASRLLALVPVLASYGL